MSRLHSIGYTGQSYYVQLKDLNRSILFYESDDRHRLIELLKKYSNLYDLRLHAYAMMDNFIHLFISNRYAIELSYVFNLIVSEYTEYFNFNYRRKNKLLDLEFSIKTKFDGCSFLSIYRYIELSPVWNGIANHPGEYPWSSYGCNAMGENSGLITPHQAYISLADDSASRRKTYRETFNL